MLDSIKSERDVEVKVITPIFKDVLGYSDAEMNWAVPVQMNFGREVRTKEADLVIKRGKDVLVVVEAKKPTEAIGGAAAQTDSYAFALGAPFSFITNGREYVLRAYYHGNKRVDVLRGAIDKITKSSFKKLISLIGSAEIGGTIGEASPDAVAPDVEKIKDYRRFFKALHGVIRDGEKLDPAAAFDELSKMLLLSAADEALSAQNKRHKKLTDDDIQGWSSTSLEMAKKHLNLHFSTVVRQAFPLLAEEASEINISPSTAQEILKRLKPFSLKSEDMDLKGRAFEEFLPSQLRGKGLGQYFTPRPIVDFMCELADISIKDTVLDFACGSGGFLIKAYEKMRSEVDILPAGTLRRMGTSRDDLIEDIKSRQIFGIDAEPRAARTARMNMLLWGDGKCVVRGNALAATDSSGEKYAIQDYDPKVEESGCTLILANPPFGARENDSEILKNYEFGSKIKSKKSQKTEVLFVEKALQLLRPEGRLLIVLPTGLLSADSYADLRAHIVQRAWVRAVVNLPTHTFVQSGVPTVNTVVLFLQKYSEEVASTVSANFDGKNFTDFQALLSKQPDLDYEIFMADSEDVGFEPSGRSTRTPNEMTDLDAIIEDFRVGGVDDVADLDIFDFAERLYGVKSARRRDQVVRGSKSGNKASFSVRASALADRMDPSYYLFARKLNEIRGDMEPIGIRIAPRTTRFMPKVEKDLDREYSLLSVSSDGQVTVRETIKGEDVTTPQKSIVKGDVVYNPMRANIGSIGIMKDAFANPLASPDYHVLKVDGIDAEYLIALLRTPFYKFYIDVITTGSIRDRLYPKNLQEMLIPKSTVASRKKLKELQSEVLAEESKYATAVSALYQNLNASVRGLVNAEKV
ncbi:type I restriction enzyme M protein [Rhizobium tibeticum]|uniref:N-6 DNA methylase n=1 Tax=Rhizobium tibeticum TaxID=501024 RepID=UPI0027821D56|nr:N-6 DNA methylase [Rhizobium tibeticum]MDP9809333.1 type I restriction enzyme M protein [Rhizobium tibeticum]